MKLATVAAVAFILCKAQDAQATSIKFDYLPAGFARTDPIVSQTCLSDHVHTFYGPQTIRPEVDYNTLINTPDSINTGNVVENKSLYWHPTVYSYDRGSDTYTRDEMAQSSAYYIWDNGLNTQAFPNGFRMIAGFNPDDPANFPNANAECVNPSPCRKEDCSTENTFFPSNACDELEVSMSFPACWDGVSLDSPNHQDHISYTLDGEFDGPCPSTHPVRIPQIQLFFRIMPYDGGWHTFSDLSSVYHADYMSGWDENKLQSVLDDCVTDSFAANPDSFCEQFLTFRDGPKCTDPSCDFGDPQLLAKLQAIQPPPLDVQSTVSPEETRVVTGSLPRGGCTGTLLPSSSGSNGAPVAPAPVPPRPVPPRPVPSDPEEPAESEDDDDDEEEEEGSGGSCRDVCRSEFDDCLDTAFEESCGDNTFLEACENDCLRNFQDEDEGDLLADCLFETCPEDQEICWEDAEQNCNRERRSCMRRCMFRRGNN